MAGERCYQIGFSLADAIDQPCWDRHGTGPQDEPITRRLDSCADQGKVVEEFTSGIRISSSAPGSTPPSMASGIGRVGPTGDGRVVRPSPSVR